MNVGTDAEVGLTVETKVGTVVGNMPVTLFAIEVGNMPVTSFAIENVLLSHRF